MRAQTEYASVSLNEQVRILAPILGFQPENVIYKLLSPRNFARFFDLYVTGALEFLSVRFTGIHSAYLYIPLRSLRGVNIVFS